MELRMVTSVQNSEFYSGHSQAYIGDSGLDLFTPKDITIPGKSLGFMIDLEVSCQFIDSQGNDMSYYLVPRSSISKTPLRMCNSVGIIDSKYRNTLKIALDNHAMEDYILKKGTRLVQIVAPSLETFTFRIVDKLSETNRGSGFGSSGM